MTLCVGTETNLRLTRAKLLPFLSRWHQQLHWSGRV